MSQLPRPPAAPQGELDELEREEFFRLKKVQGNKKKHAEAAAAKEAEEEVRPAPARAECIPSSTLCCPCRSGGARSGKWGMPS